jgi:hypothetical protein
MTRIVVKNTIEVSAEPRILEVFFKSLIMNDQPGRAYYIPPVYSILFMNFANARNIIY